MSAKKTETTKPLLGFFKHTLSGEEQKVEKNQEKTNPEKAIKESEGEPNEAFLMPSEPVSIRYSIPVSQEKKQLPQQSKRPRILLGIVTYDGHQYCLDAFAASVSALIGYSASFADIDTIAVDTSDNDGYSSALRDKGFNAVWLGKGRRTRIQKILDGRNLVRDAFLKHGYDALFFLDSDVIVQPDYLERLLSHGKDVVMGVYLNNTLVHGEQHVMPVVYVVHDAASKALRQLRHDEVIDDQLIEAAAGGLGCVLIRKKAMEAVLPFHTLSKSSTGGEDAAFYKDVIEKGFAVFCDTSVKCLHVPYPEGDSRNNLFKFKSAVVEYSATVSFG